MMTVKLLKDARIKHSAGDIVCVSPEEANFLISVKAAVVAAQPKKEAEKKAKK